MIWTGHERAATPNSARRMPFKFHFLFLLLATQPVLAGRDCAARMRLGNDALAAGLWETAVLHFGDCLADPSLKPEEKPRVAISLAESWIRQGQMEEALTLLDQSFASSHPHAPFWKGQALVELRRVGDAIEVLRPLLETPGAPFQQEAAFTTANLQLALGKSDDALATLETISGGNHSEAAARARLHQVEILLDGGAHAEAREKMPAASAVAPKDRPLASVLEAHLLLAESRPQDAATIFRKMLDQPQGHSLGRRHMAAVGLSRSLLAMKDADGAATFLLSFIQENPGSPQLHALFKHLRDALAQAPLSSATVLAKLAEWIPPASLPPSGLIPIDGSSADCAWPTASPDQELVAQALFARAASVQKTAPAEARLLLARLRAEFPQHHLASMSLLENARMALAAGAHQQALNLLASLKESSSSAKLRGKASFLEAKRALSAGDKTQAASLFSEAAKELDGRDAEAARFNAAVLQLVKAEDADLQNDLLKHPAISADLMIERALSQENPELKREAIEEFLRDHPDHPRQVEMRLAGAEAVLALPVPDLSFANSQLDAIAASPEAASQLSASRIELVRLRIADLSHNPAAAITAARQILERFPTEPAAAEASLVLGRNLFESSSYNEARMVLEKLAVTDTDPARAEAAWLMAARSAALVPTSQSQQEALILYDKVISIKRPLSSLAMLEKARLMIDMNRLSEAITFLRQWFSSLAKSDPLYFPAGLLLGEAIYGQGSADPKSLPAALAVYDSLLEATSYQSGSLHRLQYLRGRTLEQIPDERDPSRKREKDAFNAYYSVLETDTPPTEWHYFELCGFRALALLEKAGRWPAAVACARKIASFNGPRAGEAANRASQIQLKHMIWED